MDWKALGLVGLVASTGCMDLSLDQVVGSGKVTTEHRTVGKFSGIELHGAYDVNVKVGPSESVTITGDDNLLKLVTTKVEGDSLILDNTKDFRSTKNLHVDITTPSLKSFSLQGAGDANIQGVHEKKFAINLSGTGDLKATGQANMLAATLEGTGDLKLFDLHAEDVTASLSGTGDMDVYASHSLSAKMSGVGDMRYKGHPANVSKSSSGVGDIERAD